MLDIAVVRENRDAVMANCHNRLAPHAKVDEAISADDRRRAALLESQTIQQRQNEVAKLIPSQKEKGEREKLVAEGKELKARAAAAEGRVREAEQEMSAALLTLPNLTHPAAPVGHTDADNTVVKVWGEPKTFDFVPKDHVALCESLDLADFEAGASVAGAKFYFLKNEGALLELALINYAMMTAVKAGFTPVMTPDLAKVEVLEGIGFMPRDPNPDTRQVYAVADTDLCLIATAEITLGGMHRDKVLDEEKLPILYAGLSHCFRTEAGAPGRDTRGLYRVHQFTKVEMFAFATPEQSEELHEKILTIEESIFQGLGLSYHVLDTCTGDLGGPAYRKYDIEAWMPCRGEGGAYGEVTSTSNCTDFQARRLNVRSKKAGQKGTRVVHTLNGTAIACTRAIVAILENYQQADGTVVVPEVLRPWVGVDVIRPKK